MGIFGRRKERKEQENRSQEQGGQAALTIYACRTDSSDIRETAETVFQDITMQNSTGENKDFTLLLKDGTTLHFHILDDTKETAQQAVGMRNFFSNAPLENEAVKEAALMQIGLFNCIVGIEFTATQDANRTNAIVACV